MAVSLRTASPRASRLGTVGALGAIGDSVLYRERLAYAASARNGFVADARRARYTAQ